MRSFDISCDGEQQDDGSFTLCIKVTGLTLDQAQAIGDRMKDPFRDICLDVLTKGGAIAHTRRDMLKDTTQ